MERYGTRQEKPAARRRTNRALTDGSGEPDPLADQREQVRDHVAAQPSATDPEDVQVGGDGLESVDFVEGGVTVALDEAPVRLVPERSGWLVRAYCKVFGHAWDGHKHHDGDEVYPAASCRRCLETRVAGVTLAEALAAKVHGPGVPGDE